MYGVYMEVMIWSVGWTTPVRFDLYLIYHPYISGVAYPYIYHHPCTITAITRKTVQAHCLEHHGNSWSCLGCRWSSYCCLYGDPPLSDMVHASYKTHDKCDSISIPSSSSLDNYSGLGVTCSYQTGSVPRITLIDKWDSISIPVSSSLENCNNKEEHGSRSWFF